MKDVVKMMDGKLVSDLLSSGGAGGKLRAKLQYKDSKGKTKWLGTASIKYNIEKGYVISVPPSEDEAPDPPGHHVQALCATDDEGCHTEIPVRPLYEADSFDALYFYSDELENIDHSNTATPGVSAYGLDTPPDLEIAHRKMRADGKTTNWMYQEQLGTQQAFDPPCFRSRGSRPFDYVKDEFFISGVFDVPIDEALPCSDELEGYLGNGTYIDRAGKIHLSHMVTRTVSNYERSIKTIVHQSQRFVDDLPTSAQVNALLSGTLTEEQADRLDLVDITPPKGVKSALHPKNYPHWHEVIWK